MGFNLDYTALVPGPAGTTMIGERTIEAAARRGMERKKREEEERAKNMEGQSMVSGTTLAPEESRADDSQKKGDETPEVKTEKRSKFQERLRRFEKMIGA